ncbi:xanthine dehydrogenase family protein molybdopterin-binding subunit [Paenochrobactrum glaciei]|uniref:Xanthine dehydrogenase family protein molybdopterin-binding subunit n=1 Tax=Paenochrobactrum glaciei TaxID=486407 RepID=A0ABP3RL44_9HYPH
MTLTGSSVKRYDAVEKVTGRAQYAADHQPDNCLVAMALRADQAPARIVKIESVSARALPGVVDVFCHENAHKLDWFSRPEVDALSAESLGRTVLADAASKLPAYRPFITDEIQFAGQWIAIVVADTIETAREALLRIKVELEDLPNITEQPILPGPFFGGEMQHSFETTHPAGNTVAIVDQVYQTPIQLHQPMEPSATVAHWDEDNVTLWDSTQGAYATRDYIAASLELPQDKVRVISAYVGGGFGSKNQIWPHQALAAHLARYLKHPVRVQLTRQDMTLVSGHRSETRQHIRLEADADGRLSLLHHNTEVPTSLRGGFFEPCGLSSLMLYAAKKITVSHHVQRSPIPTPTPFRAPGETPGSFALETALDELAHIQKIDPLELRLRNFADHDYSHQRPWSSNYLRDCYNQGSDAFGWSSRNAVPGQTFRNGRKIGMGMATTAYPAPLLPATVRLRLRRDKPLRIETSATDIGTGMRTILAQKVASELGLTLNDVEVCLGDTQFPYAPTAGRSKSTSSVMPAAADACRNLLEKLGREGKNTSLQDRLKELGTLEIEVEGSSGPRKEDGHLSFYSFGAHFVEVELDEQIGRLRVTRVVSALDCGRVLNPLLAASQIRGGIIFGIGMALMEEGIRHPTTHKLLTDNLADYAVPVHADVPEIDVRFINKPDFAMGDDGARGLGEIGLPGLSAAIGNAFFNATGRRARSVPIPFSLMTKD